MDIQLLQDPINDVIGYETISEDTYGEFYLNEAGEVHYRFESNRIFVNIDRETFEKCVSAWSQYQQVVQETEGEEAQLAVVAILRERIIEVSTSLDRPDGFWSMIIEQAEWGHL